jgi:pyruvate dehydrogenase E2 component (dihydrolipoamide acetyltransferase)/2-oxoisovalerate dehydrogenase E2 component (dihydrolipoyl transacylase)
MKTIHTVNLPDIGEGVVEGEVIEWLKNVGDPLAQDEPVVIVMTDKATVELPAPYPGILFKQHYQPGQVAYKDQPLYDIEIADSGPAAGQQVLVEPAKALPAKEEVPLEQKSKPAPEMVLKAGHALATPPVRHLARELGINIDLVMGSGKNGRVTVEDLKAYQSQVSMLRPSETPISRLPEDEEKPIIGIRLLMAKKMAESHAAIPQFSFFERVDATRLVQLRDHFKEQGALEGIHVTYTPFLIRALSLTIKKHLALNSSVDLVNNKLIIHKAHHVGIAINTPLGLIVPVLKNIQELSMYDLIRSYESLKKRALENKLLASDMKGATITLSNYGVLGGGGLWATPIINYPEVAILATARIQKHPLVKGDEVQIRETLHLSWSFDHRVIDGDMAANISHDYAMLIQNPAALL